MTRFPDNQEEEFIELINNAAVAVDVSGWRVDGAVRFTLAPGTVIPPGGSLFLSPDQTAFRGRELSPSGGEQRFVVGPYRGNLSAEGETIDLYDAEEVLQTSHTFSGSDPGFDGNGRADEDEDGLSALLEFALGTSDESYTSLAAPVAGKFSYTVQANLNGFALVVEVSENLQEWSREGIVEADRISLSEGQERVTVDLPEGLTRGFVRLSLERLP